MGPRRQGPPQKAASATGRSRGNKKKAEKEKPKAWLRPKNHHDDPPVDLSASVPLPLQQLLLDVFKFALLFPGNDQSGAGERVSVQHPDALECSSAELNLKSLIQTIKSHLYNRDFNSAFVEANEELLRAYALRWSATRALGYAGILKGVCNAIFNDCDRQGSECSTWEKNRDIRTTNRIVCIGGGAGAEIIALAAVWRDMLASWNHRAKDNIASLQAAVADLSIKHDTRSGASEGGAPVKQSEESNQSVQQGEHETASKDINDGGHDDPRQTPSKFPNLSVIAVDIADWSAIVETLAKAIQSPSVPGSKSHPAPLLPSVCRDRDQDQGGGFDISFRRFDVLSCQNDEDMKPLLRGTSLPSYGDNNEDALHEKTVLITLMFTLNELFSTSITKTTAFLLKITEWAEPGAILLVVDSPGSYSTVSLTGKAKPDPDVSATVDERNDVTLRQQQQQRVYPMKFLLDHTLMSVAAGKWQRMVTEDSRWFRRDTSKLRYNVGDGAGLEDMRFQIHIYRRLEY
jgi:25S rRNA (uracil2843-N3)-methyltransferase